MTGRFTGKVALVTAAAAGIGAATAHAFAHEGAMVMLTDINEEFGLAQRDSLLKAGAKVDFLRVDAGSEDDVEKMVRKTVETFGGLDIAANVVGAAHPDSIGPDFHLQSRAGWDATLELTMSSVFLSMKYEIAEMLKNGGGSICNVSSLSAMTFNPDGGMAYSAAKSAVIRMTKFAAVNYADRNIRVNCISPGLTLTDAYQRFDEDEKSKMLERYLQGHAIKRGVKSEEQADAILYLCSNQAAMVTGHNLTVDGGWAARF
ncbi:MAG: SDR family oxidoreductase [Spongiibacteraceae bacterium]